VLTSPEFRLAVASCRGTFAPLEPAEIHALFAGVDWSRLVRLSRFHRIQGLVWQSLKPWKEQLLAQWAKALAEDARAIAAANLRTAAECSGLSAAFAAERIDLLFLKGLTLGALAYGNIAGKAGVDIDLLIAPEKLGNAAELLRQRGYRLAAPAGDPGAAQLAAWHGSRKESVWVHGNEKLQVDLHTALADQPRLIPSIGLNSPRQIVEVAPGIALPTLAPVELFTYLTVHGASSAWFRLKWITDLAAILHRSPPDEIESLYRRSRQLGAGRASAWALLLADELYDSLTSHQALRRELERDPANRRLVNITLNRLAGEPVEPTSRQFGTLFIHAAQFALLPGWRFKLSELRRQARSAFDGFRANAS
jgi:hypothetical protein